MWLIGYQVSQLYGDLDEGLSILSVFFPHAPTKVNECAYYYLLRFRFSTPDVTPCANLLTQAHKKRDIARKKIVDIFSGVIQKRRADLKAGKSTYLFPLQSCWLHR